MGEDLVGELQAMAEEEAMDGAKAGPRVMAMEEPEDRSLCLSTTKNAQLPHPFIDNELPALRKGKTETWREITGLWLSF